MSDDAVNNDPEPVSGEIPEENPPQMRGPIDLDGATRAVLGIALETDWRLTKSKLADALYSITDDGLTTLRLESLSLLLALADTLAFDAPDQKSRRFEATSISWAIELHRTSKRGPSFSESLSSITRNARALEIFETEKSKGQFAKQARWTVGKSVGVTDRSTEKLIKQARQEKQKWAKVIRELEKQGYIVVKPKGSAT